MKRILVFVTVSILILQLCCPFAAAADTIDIDDFTAAMYRCYSNLSMVTTFTEYMSLVKEDSAYPVSYSVMYDAGTGDSVYLGSISFNSSSYDNGEGGSKNDVDNVRYVLPVSVEYDDNSSAMTIFSATCAAILFAMDEEYYAGAVKEAMEADATIEEIFSIDAKTVNGFQSDSFEIGDYQYAVTLYGPNDSGICRYAIEGGPKDTLFGMFYSLAKIREAASRL